MPARQEVFLLHTLTDAQAVVSEDIDARLFGGDSSRPAPWGADATRVGEAVRTLAELGFLVPTRETDDHELERYFAAVRHDPSELRVTVLTTLRCNFGCDYCVQGDHDAGAPHMSLDTAEQVCAWIERQLDTVRPRRLLVTFFGGEPLLNLPALEHVARRAHAAGQARGVEVALDIITNGLLLTRAVVDRLLPYGLRGVKITLDGDRERHDRQRPLKGGQGTFDRILANLRAIAGTCRIAIGGNVDADAVDDCTRLLDRLAAEPFADAIGKVHFKPIVGRAPAGHPKVIPLVPAERAGGALASAAPSSSPCDTCAFADDAYARLRGETARRGFATPDDVEALESCQKGFAAREFEGAHITRTPSAPTALATSARDSRAARRTPSATCSGTPPPPSGRWRRAARASQPGARAATAPTSRCAPAGAPWPRTTNGTTSRPRRATSRPSRRPPSTSPTRSSHRRQHEASRRRPQHRQASEASDLPVVHRQPGRPAAAEGQVIAAVRV